MESKAKKIETLDDLKAWRLFYNAKNDNWLQIEKEWVNESLDKVNKRISKENLHRPPVELPGLTNDGVYLPPEKNCMADEAFAEHILSLNDDGSGFFSPQNRNEWYSLLREYREYLDTPETTPPALKWTGAKTKLFQIFHALCKFKHDGQIEPLNKEIVFSNLDTLLNADIHKLKNAVAAKCDKPKAFSNKDLIYSILQSSPDLNKSDIALPTVSKSQWYGTPEDFYSLTVYIYGLKKIQNTVTNEVASLHEVFMFLSNLFSGENLSWENMKLWFESESKKTMQSGARFPLISKLDNFLQDPKTHK